MLESFVAWLDNYLIGKGAPAVVKAILGILAFASLLGVIIGNSAIRSGILLSVVFLVLAMMILLLADRRRLQKVSANHQKLLARYCAFIHDGDQQPTILIKKWTQVVTVDAKGNTQESVTIKAVSMRENLYFIRLRIGASWPQPQKQRDKVKVDIRSLLVAGRTGTSWDVTYSWLADGRINILAHLHEPVRHGGELTIQMKRNWPGKCIPLMIDREPDEFMLQFNKAMPIEAAQYEVILPPDFDAHYEPIGFELADKGFNIKAKIDSENRWHFTLTTPSFEPNHRVGMRLELK